MADEPGGSVPTGFVERLLALPSPEQGPALLRTSGLLDDEGLQGLLDVADRLVRSNPGEAALPKALEVMARFGVPRSAYILLQTHFMRGEFDAALRMAG